MRKKGVILSILLLAILIPFASAGFSDWFKKNIQKSPQDVSVQVGNAIPVVTVVTTPGSVSLIAASTVQVPIEFTASDQNGRDDLVDSSVSISFDHQTLAEQRTGTFSDCTPSNIDTTTKRYDCIIDIEHYTGQGTWDITVSIGDGTDTGTDNDDTFIIQLLKAIDVDPDTITFGSVIPGGPAALGDNTQVFNEGNHNIATDELQITAQDLIGELFPTETIPADRFNSADQSEGDVCNNGVSLVDNTAISISNFILAKGTSGTPLPTRDVVHCLFDIPTGLSDQTYSALGTGGNQWEFTII